jgi:hypothetical protein
MGHRFTRNAKKKEITERRELGLKKAGKGDPRVYSPNRSREAWFLKKGQEGAASCGKLKTLRLSKCKVRPEPLGLNGLTDFAEV